MLGVSFINRISHKVSELDIQKLSERFLNIVIALRADTRFLKFSMKSFPGVEM